MAKKKIKTAQDDPRWRDGSKACRAWLITEYAKRGK